MGDDWFDSLFSGAPPSSKSSALPRPELKVSAPTVTKRTGDVLPGEGTSVLADWQRRKLPSMKKAYEKLGLPWSKTWIDEQVAKRVATRNKPKKSTRRKKKSEEVQDE